MLLKKRFLGAIFSVFIGLSGLFAQEAIPVSGGDASGSGGSASYTIGQIVYTTNTGTTGSVAQGVQQAYEIFVITGNQEIKGINLTCSVYPNPATDFLKLNVQDFGNENLSYILYDLKGKVLETNAVSSSETTINMGTLVAGTYFLKLLQSTNASSQEVKTFKIVKIK
jgi:hypothetical protein